MVNEKTLFAMDLTALMAVEKIAKDSQRPQEDVLVDFMESNTAKMLYDDSNKLWWDGPDATAEEFVREKSLT